MAWENSCLLISGRSSTVCRMPSTICPIPSISLLSCPVSCLPEAKDSASHKYWCNHSEHFTVWHISSWENLPIYVSPDCAWNAYLPFPDYCLMSCLLKSTVEMIMCEKTLALNFPLQCPLTVYGANYLFRCFLSSLKFLLLGFETSCI